MYLTRLALDPQRRETMQALSAPQLLHGAIENAFTGERKRKLWRIDWLGEGCYLLLLSEEPPDLNHAMAQFGFLDMSQPWQSRDYTQLLNRLSSGQTWQFRLKANPVKNKALAEKTERGKVLAHVTPEQQKTWLMNRSASCGFSLTPEQFDVTHTAWLRFYKGSGPRVTLKTAVFEGSLRIEDLQLFKQTLTQGIGRGKAYGCGLLTLARPRQ